MAQELALKLDAKDQAILRELDKDYRKSFSGIGKKVGLSKNSVSLRFEKLKGLTLHNLAGINYKKLGFTEVRLYYTFDYYSNETEKEIIDELKKYDHVMWAARFYGSYDLIVCYLISNLNDLIRETNSFHTRFAKKINQKHKHMVYRTYHFRYNFLHKKPIYQVYKIENVDKIIKMTVSDKKILRTLYLKPRMHLIDISQKTGLTIKTVSKRIKDLEKNGVLTGYFMTLDITRFNHTAFKLVMQVNDLKDERKFEHYLTKHYHIKNIHRHSGEWDYEIDFIYPTIRELQAQIEEMKQKFPELIKKISIISFGGRIFTNNEPLFM